MSAVVSILDVAREAGVSPSTVSRVLNGSPVPAEDTRHRVLAAVEKLGYRPDPAAQSLRRGAGKAGAGRTNAVGLLYYDLADSVWISNDFYNRVFVSMERTADALRQYLVVSRVADDGLVPRVVAEAKVDGVVTVGHVPGRVVEAIAKRLPAVLFNYRVDDANADSVMPDNRQGIRDAVRHLHGLGHRRFAFLGRGEERHLHVQERLAAFGEALREFGLEENEAYRRFAFGRNCMEIAARNVDLFLDLGEDRPTALVCAGDVTARGFASVARSRGVRVPEDVSLVGFDDTISATSEEPHLTTIHQPLEEMAKLAVETVVQRAGGDKGPRRRSLVETALVIRQSSGPAR